jgi:hypothetical protein
VRFAISQAPCNTDDYIHADSAGQGGWDQDARPIDPFTDIRELQARLKAAGATIEQEVDEASTGPASFIISDPDGNPILVDQHR